jgi:hypothetical protein
MALGSLKFRGIGLGTAGVLFAGIIVGHFGNPVDQHTLHFVKEFGLMLFVFTIGLQLGPGFAAALRNQGVKLNLLAAAIVILGAQCTAHRRAGRVRHGGGAQSLWRGHDIPTRRGLADAQHSAEHHAGSPALPALVTPLPTRCDIGIIGR